MVERKDHNGRADVGLFWDQNYGKEKDLKPLNSCFQSFLKIFGKGGGVQILDQGLQGPVCRLALHGCSCHIDQGSGRISSTKQRWCEVFGGGHATFIRTRSKGSSGSTIQDNCQFSLL